MGGHSRTEPVTCRYHEQYYVFVRSQDGDNPKLHRHTLPPFVPIEKLSALLKSGLKQFMIAVSSYLNAYVGRREQVKRMKRDHSEHLIDDCRCSAAVDFVVFTLAHNGRKLDVKLLYENLESMLPTRAVATSTVDNDSEDESPKSSQSVRDRSTERLLKSKFLADALSAASV